MNDTQIYGRTKMDVKTMKRMSAQFLDSAICDLKTNDGMPSLFLFAGRIEIETQLTHARSNFGDHLVLEPHLINVAINFSATLCLKTTRKMPKI